MHILFVCTGNICRSPTAERLAAAYGSALEIANLSASSAGTQAVIGSPMHPDAARVLADLGGDPAGFTARHLTPRIASNADLVIAMTRVHREAVLELAPRQLSRTFTLMEAARLVSECGAEDVRSLAALRSRLGRDGLTDIPDPIGQDPQYFADIGSMIAAALRPVMMLCRNNSGDSA